MIKTNKIAEPLFFKSEVYRDLRQQISSHYAQAEASRSQTRFPLGDLGDQLQQHISESLIKKTDQKCMFCESRISEKDMIVNHFRPHSAAADLKGEISPDHYWWLALKWNNLYPSCLDCNSYKRNYFPVSKKRAEVRYSSKETLFNIEQPIFLDPEFENPEEHFSYLEDGTIVSETERGRLTIEIFNLNRRSLIEGRRNAARDAMGILFEDMRVNTGGYEYIENYNVDDFESQLQGNLFQIRTLDDYFINSNMEYLGIRRFMVRKYFNSELYQPEVKAMDTNLKRHLNVKLKTSNIDYSFAENFNNRLEVNSIKINNYRSIESIEINFQRTTDGRAGWAILIGENGVGKSSVLTATLKTLVGRSYNGLRFRNDEINRNLSVDFADVNITINDSITASVKVARQIKYEQPKGYFINSSILAFGPFKHSNKRDSNYRKFKGGCFVDNFFNPAMPLHNAKRFLLQLSGSQFDYVAIAILDLFMLEGKATIRRDINEERLWIQNNETGNIKFFDELSDGYMSILTLGCNIVEGLLLNNENIQDASGFVVVDEIGANLHPRWKMEIVKRLRNTFRNVQFLVTTHDPLCLKGIEADETYVLRSDNDKFEVLTDLPNPSEFRADQLLTSEFFGLYSTIDPEIEKDFKEYYELLHEKDSKANGNENRIEHLKDQLRKKNHLGNSLREELLYEAIDTILAKHQASEEPFSRAKVEKEVKMKAIDLIDEFLGDLEE